MRRLAYSLTIAGMVGALGTATFAASETDAATLTCADFMAMSADEQRSTLDSLASSNADTTAVPEPDAATELSAEADAGADAVGTEDTSAEADPSPTDELSTDPDVEAVMASCAGNDDALVADQMAP